MTNKREERLQFFVAEAHEQQIKRREARAAGVNRNSGNADQRGLLVSLTQGGVD